MTSWMVLNAILMAAPVPFYFLCQRFLGRKRKTGLTADLTTFLLFLSVPLSVEFIYGVPLFAPLATVVTAMAIALLYLEWKQTKEIDVMVFFRKTWRIYFTFLAVTYIMCWLIGVPLMIYRSL